MACGLKYVMDLTEKTNRTGLALDFGCGMGTMLPFLMSRMKKVVALDLDTTIVEQVARSENWSHIVFSNNLKQVLLDHRHQFDIIYAMDVLEHVSDLENTLGDLKALLKPSGILYITGPTENWFYKLGRKLAHYSGHYHVRRIYDIVHTSRAYFTVRHQKTLIPPVPLFEIYTATSIDE